MLVAIEHVPIRTNPKLARVAAVPLDVELHPPQRGLDLPRVRDVRAAARVHDRRGAARARRARRLGRASSASSRQGDGGGHIQSLILGSVLFQVATVLAALGVLGDLLSGQRITLQRIFERVRRIELELGVPPSHYEPGSEETGHEPTTGARAGQRGRTEEREALSCEHRHARRRGHGHRQHVRQVRLDEPGRAPADGRLRAHARRAARRRPPRARSSTSAAARACSSTSGRSATRRRASSGSTSRTPDIQAGWAQHQAPNLEYRIIKAENLPFADGEFDARVGDRGARARARPGAHRRRDGARRARRAPARLGAARAAVARPEHGARRLPEATSGTPPGTSTTGPSARSSAALAPRRGRRGALAVPVDDAARPRLAASVHRGERTPGEAAASAAEPRGYGAGARILSIGIATTGVVTFAYFSLASHALSDADYSHISLLWAVLFVIVSVHLPADRAAALAHDRRPPRARARARPPAAHAADHPGRLRGHVPVVALALQRADHRRPLRRLRRAVLGPVLRRARLRRELLRARLAGRAPVVRALRRPRALEATSRCLFALAVVLGIAEGQTAVALGMAAAPLVSLVVVPLAFSRRTRSSAAPRGARRGGAGPGRGGRFALAVFASCSPSRR